MDNDLESIISEMSKVDLRSETDKMMERTRLGEIRYSKLSEVSAEHIKNDRFKYLADCLALPVLPESRTIIHIGMDFAKQEAPLSKWQRFKSFFKRKCKK